MAAEEASKDEPRKRQCYYVCLFYGFEFFDAWLSHASSTFFHGVYFLLALILVFVFPFLLFEKK